MQYTQEYESPMGKILLACDEVGLIGLWFWGAKYFAHGLAPDPIRQEHPVLAQARQWLDLYFAGKEPAFMPPLHPMGSPFQLAVWAILRQIPYGETTSYGAIAQTLARQSARSRVSAQAVGGAVGHNRISVIIPCHRVVGAGGSLTGYAGGIDKKIQLLTLEKADQAGLFRPTKGTAL